MSKPLPKPDPMASFSSPTPKEDPTADDTTATNPEKDPTADDTATTTPEKKFTLQTSDGELFSVGEAIAVQSITIKNMIEDDCATSIIPLPNVDSRCMAKIIEYCCKHIAVPGASVASSSSYSYIYSGSYTGTGDPPTQDDEMKKWDKNFADIHDQALLFDLILAANYLNIKGLLEILCEKVASMMSGKTPEQIRETFHIVNDYTAEEEEEVRRENAWAFEN